MPRLAFTSRWFASWLTFPGRLLSLRLPALFTSSRGSSGFRSGLFQNFRQRLGLLTQCLLCLGQRLASLNSWLIVLLRLSSFCSLSRGFRCPFQLFLCLCGFVVGHVLNIV